MSLPKKFTRSSKRAQINWGAPKKGAPFLSLGGY